MSLPSLLQETQSFLSADLQRVNQVILSRTASQAMLIPLIAERIIRSGGKRLRPMLTLLSSRLCGYRDGERHITLAAAVECIHTATLLHDDVVDESVLRRNLPTANATWGNKASILVGDFLLSQALQLMVADGSLEALNVLSNASAVIAEGEVMQLSSIRDLHITEATYFQIIQAKTAELFAAACEIGAIAAGVPKEQRARLREAGMALGIAFQLVDDALDYSARQEELGKTVGDDFREGKVTLPILWAYARATKEERMFFERTITEGIQHDTDLAMVMHMIEKHDVLQDIFARARQHADEALALLDHFPECEEKRMLADLVVFSVDRPF